MLSRVKFLIQMMKKRVPSWHTSEGHHVYPQSYNILTDRVTYRQGRFGYVDFTSSMTRENYMSHDEPWEKQSAD